MKVAQLPRRPTDEERPEPPARAQAVEAMLFAAQRMHLPLSTRQAATLLKVAEQKLHPPVETQTPASDRSDWPHGTIAGYKRHLRSDERACPACREACRLHSAERRQRQGGRELQPCGTLAAYHRHLRRFEDPCEPCKTAKREYHRDYKARQRNAA
ncbi:hypothetical protein [Streptomyces sp. H27-C3]|uniref:hypothetical protein n=1 Tax=Streptomyces sp. H27-C3 TaxID=3046305 RepID=UPI0024B96875|nr:hypothetical protein [Streptomyces sp. H27-C3]MDJ0466088.1 hypothetical protein [Streptomyces sp. H27-C3]